MPRRPSKKGRGGSGGGNRTARPLSRADGKVKKWNKASDVPLDEEDQFHASKDKILLEGDEYDDDGDDDEVFALKGMVDDSDDDIEGEDEEEEEIVEEAPTRKSKSKKSKSKKKAASSSSEESESEEEIWGQGKSAYYSSNAAQLESDDEEGNELEEQEAKRLQGKMRDGMGEGDFGLQDSPEVRGDEEADGLGEPAPKVLPPLSGDKKFLIRHLEKTSPEALALARDWDDTARNLMKTREKITKVQSEEPDALSLGMMHLHYQTLLTYTTILAFYLHLRSSEKYAQHPGLLKSHPIFSRMLTLKQSLATLEDLDFAASDSEDERDEDESGEEDDLSPLEDVLDFSEDAEELWMLDRQNGLESGELNDLLKDVMSAYKEPISKSGSTAEKPPKKKRKTSSDTAKPNAPVFDLVEPEFTSSKSSALHSQTDARNADAYGEVVSLQHGDAADKSARKRTLRFHTSKIESASARRQGARNQASGGDDDIPYRERRKDKETRLAKEAKTKVRGQGGEDLDDVEPERKVEKRRREDESGDEAEGPDGYYELVKRQTKDKNERKKAEYETATQLDFNDDDASGPRSLTRAILANKGLTPRRPKSVRNPRVKKRLKFEKAKRTISSQKAVYKGGISETGRYDGEKSGISKVVKSVRLG